MIGQSESLQALRTLIGKVARYDAPVLIEGETGTGKEVAARAIHYQSARRDRPFVPVNCGALTDSLIESELFGHRRGAFTDARRDQQGLVALAHSGTLLLDEVDALTPKAQVTLLRFLQDQQYRPLGGEREEHTDARIIAASNAPLMALVENGRFRLDLLYRLKLMHVVLPPLRDRRGDLPLLADHFVRIGSARFGRPIRPLAAATLSWFEQALLAGKRPRTRTHDLSRVAARRRRDYLDFVATVPWRRCGGHEPDALSRRERAGDRGIRACLSRPHHRRIERERVGRRTSRRHRTPPSRSPAEEAPSRPNGLPLLMS